MISVSIAAMGHAAWAGNFINHQITTVKNPLRLRASAVTNITIFPLRPLRLCGETY